MEKKGVKNLMTTVFRVLLFAFPVFLGAMNPAYAQWAQKNNTSSSVNCFAVAGANLVAGTNSGILLSNDSGMYWNGSNNGLTTTNVLALVKSGGNLFAGVFGGGVFVSNDDGANWTSVSNGLNAHVCALAVLGTRLFAGTSDGGAYRSTNNGSNWTAVNNGLPTSGVSITSFAVSGTFLFAGTSTKGVYMSADYGGSWNKVSNGLTTYDLGILTLLSNGSNLFAGTNGGGVCRSTDLGSNWTEVNNGLLTYGGVYSLAVSGSTLFAGTKNPDNGVYFTTDNGANWTAFNLGLVKDIQCLGVYGAYLFAGTSKDGIWRRLLSQTTPVELALFNARRNNDYINLNWSTATERNSFGFDIERSNQPTVWEKIGFVASHGTTTAAQEYAFIDKNLYVTSELCYRLKMIDLDGSSSYSQVLKIPVGILPASPELHAVFPNPSKQDAVINFSLPLDETIGIVVYDMLGNVVKQIYDNEMLNAGSYSHILQMNGYPNGKYIVRLSAGNYRKTESFILQR